VGGEHHAPPALPQGNNPVPTIKEAGWAPGLTSYGQSGPPPDFSPCIIQPVVSTEYAIPACSTSKCAGAKYGTYTQILIIR